MGLTETILGACKDWKDERVWVPTPDWKCEGVWVHMLRADEAGAILGLRESMKDIAAEEAFWIAAWTMLCACDEGGQRLFAKADIPVLLKGPLRPLHKCANAAMDLNGASVEAKDEMVGNSKVDQSEGSPSS